jgi:formate-dependent nitrite reductase cytochrome c552 subunit
LEGLKRYPVAKNGKVLLVTCNPHIQRTGQGVQDAYQKAGREDIQVSVCGPGADEKANFYIALGELGRLLWDAQQRRG